MLYLLAPLVLLFSYTRKPRLGNAGALIPVGAFALIALLYLEAGHQAIPMFNPPKLNFEVLTDPSVLEGMEDFSGEEGLTADEWPAADPAAEELTAEELTAEPPAAEELTTEEPAAEEPAAE